MPKCKDGFAITFSQSCVNITQRVLDSSHYNFEQYSFGLVSSSYPYSKYLITKTNIIGEILELKLTYSSLMPQTGYTQIAVIYPDGVFRRDGTTFLPHKLESKIRFQNFSGDELSVDWTPYKNHLFSVLILRLNQSLFSNSRARLYSAYTYSGVKLSSSDYFGYWLNDYYDSMYLYWDTSCAILLLYKQNTHGSRITFRVPATIPVDTYINGEKYTTIPINGIAEGVITPSQQSEYYFVIHVIGPEPEYREFELARDLVNDPETLALAYTGNLEFLLDYHICPPPLLLNEETFKCIEKCPGKMIQLNRTCVNPCRDRYPNIYNESSCVWGYYI